MGVWGFWGFRDGLRLRIQGRRRLLFVDAPPSCQFVQLLDREAFLVVGYRQRDESQGFTA